MNFTLTPALEQFVLVRMESGEYQSQSEVICEALRLLMRQEEYRALRLQRLRAAVKEGTDALDRGDYSELATAEELDALFASF